jgi:VIT1/CCC1 family predicted Fe2+/Mn2+ transporter
MTSSKRLLDPVDRISEVLFGLIMALTFTGALSVASAGKEEVNEMLVGALGCNLAWGIVDGVMYVLACLTESGMKLKALKAARRDDDPEQALETIAGALPPMIAALVTHDELESIRQRLRALPEPPRRVPLARKDLLGAVAVMLLVFLSTFPVVIPFLFMEDARTALRTSNAIAIGLLFLGGFSYGHHAGLRRGLMGLAMVVIGILLVGMTIALGG